MNICRKHLVTAAAVLMIGVQSGAAAHPSLAASTIRVGPSQTKVIRGDVLWMRFARDHSLLVPWALDFRGRQCWAPLDVQEDCTMLVSRRRNGRRTLINGSGVAVNVRYAARF